jgi:pyrroloquinoline quinone biosynthesis protein B
VIFIHFNHTNPALQPNSKERNELTLLGYKFAAEGKRFEL